MVHTSRNIITSRMFESNWNKSSEVQGQKRASDSGDINDLLQLVNTLVPPNPTIRTGQTGQTDDDSEFLLNTVCAEEMIDQTTAAEPWHSQSPSSSESAESYLSSLFHSPASGDQFHPSLLDAAISLETISKSFGSYLPSPTRTDFITDETQFDDYVPMTQSSLLFDDSSVDHPTTEESAYNSVEMQVLASHNPNSTPPPTMSTLRDSPQPQGHQDSLIQSSPPRNQRPNSLRLCTADAVPSAGETPMSFTNFTLSPEFEEQLTSADRAWFGTLNIPAIYPEEIDQILSCDNASTNFSTDYHHDDQASQSTGNQTIDDEHRLPSKDSPIIPDMENSPSNSSGISTSSKDHTSRLASFLGLRPSPTESPISVDPSNRQIPYDSTISSTLSEHAFDSDDTLTCSEAEYYSNQLKEQPSTAEMRRRRGPIRRKQFQTSSKSFESADSDSMSSSEDDESNLGSSHRKWSSKRLLPTTKQPTCRRFHKTLMPDAELKPWWPGNVPIPYRGGCNEVSHAESLMEHDRIEEGKKTGEIFSSHSPQRGGGEGAQSVETDTDDVPQRMVEGKAVQMNPVKKRSKQTMRARRRRKQMELWQFILYRLQMSKQSAFQWVNRPAGVFRIKDTHQGAREWGRYRNNCRMDYEKMARAMRFYYKDCILRKARQQLHFQFAMPYVEWALAMYRPGPS